jgi:hypothetical protein
MPLNSQSATLIYQVISFHFAEFIALPYDSFIFEPHALFLLSSFASAAAGEELSRLHDAADTPPDQKDITALMPPP